MEMLELYTQDGKATGVYKERADVHKSGNWHATVHIWILSESHKFLLQKRSATKENFPNSWDVSCAGHVVAGEEPLLACQRELQEELGVVCEQGELKFVGRLSQEYVLNEGTYIDKEWVWVYALLSPKWNENNWNENTKWSATEEVCGVCWKDVSEFSMLSKLSKEPLNAIQQNVVPHPEEYRLMAEYVKTLFPIAQKD